MTTSTVFWILNLYILMIEYRSIYINDLIYIDAVSWSILHTMGQLIGHWDHLDLDTLIIRDFDVSTKIPAMNHSRVNSSLHKFVQFHSQDMNFPKEITTQLYRQFLALGAESEWKGSQKSSCRGFLTSKQSQVRLGFFPTFRLVKIQPHDSAG